MVLDQPQHRAPGAAAARHVLLARPVGAARVRLRLALEALGPIFVKFGQVLSTRRDLLPPTSPTSWRSCRTACRPSPPPGGGRARARLRQAGRRGVRLSSAEPVASASVAQVHFATLPDGREVAVKILRPGIGA
jgi:ubiquinone biosynthesis protein